MTLKIVLTNNISEIPGFLKEVSGFGEKSSISEEVLSDIKLILEEIISNIIFYGFDDDRQHDITTTLTFTDDLVMISVEDEGKPFNPIEYTEAKTGKPLEEYEHGGMGILLVKNLIHEMEYKREHGKNILVMKKRINE